MSKEDLPDSNFIHDDLKIVHKQICEIKRVEKYGIAAQGRSELIAHLQGKRLYASKAIRAFCYGCMSYYEDGKEDCGDLMCPLHPHTPYRSKIGQLASLPAKNEGAPVCSHPPQTGNSKTGAGL